MGSRKGEKVAGKIKEFQRTMPKPGRMLDRIQKLPWQKLAQWPIGAINYHYGKI
jgi:hypothetical protein